MSAYKFSRQREAIRENLMHRKDHPTADMVYTDIRQIYPNISLGTVYRNLTLLAGQNVIRKVVTDDGILRFDATTTPHDHFVCRRCNRVIDLQPGSRDYTRVLPGEDFEGDVEDYQLTFYGVCGECKHAQ
ncbi:MAG: transcriptional repressor [Eubacterium sp.]|nr:transcriptional repressor [Eubacterium sp.]MBR3276057.1 transcriptional repressor [Eubacterium sp.]